MESRAPASPRHNINRRAVTAVRLRFRATTFGLWISASHRTGHFFGLNQESERDKRAISFWYVWGYDQPKIGFNHAFSAA